MEVAELKTEQPDFTDSFTILPLIRILIFNINAENVFLIFFKCLKYSLKITEHLCTFSKIKSEFKNCEKPQVVMVTNLFIN